MATPEQLDDLARSLDRELLRAQTDYDALLTRAAAWADDLKALHSDRVAFLAGRGQEEYEQCLDFALLLAYAVATKAQVECVRDAARNEADDGIPDLYGPPAESP